ncbi:MAG: hypothetical protein ABS47_01030 [Devosia sp. SCN 66-27]|nr:MAG: hypothetical protein ABS47_01030 [Devosia sp. SCN 66-27]
MVKAVHVLRMDFIDFSLLGQRSQMRIKPLHGSLSGAVLCANAFVRGKLSDFPIADDVVSSPGSPSN